MAILNRPVLRAFVGAPSGLAALMACGVILFFVLFGPALFTKPAVALNVVAADEQPSWGHLLGTDSLGRDILARILYATRLSIGLGLGATALAVALGVLAGAGAALLGGGLQRVALRVIDAGLAFPGLLTAIFVITMIGLGGAAALIGVGVAIAPGVARLTSTLALSITGREYIYAARVIGVRRSRLLFRYVLPNIAEPLILATSVAAARSIVTVSSLSFLGLGIQPPQFDWGRMLTEGIQAIYLTPAAAIGPAAAIAVTALAFGLAGEAFSRAMNPLLWPLSDRSQARDGEAAAMPTAARPGLLGATDATRPGEHGSSSAPANGSRPPILEVADLVVSFPTSAGTTEVVKGVSFSIAPGERVGIVGESGSGKTMTALSIAGLTPFPGQMGGTVKLDGQDVTRQPESVRNKLLGKALAVVFQDPMSSLNPALTIGTQLTQGVRFHQRLRRGRANALAIARLKEVHMHAPERQLHRYPHEFSGGMRQRTMIAMGLMREPSLLIADEPTTALDVTIQAQVMDLLQEVSGSHGAAIILITHNLALVSQNCDRVFVMYAGRIVEDLPAWRLAHALHPYTRALMRAIPELGYAQDQPLEQIPGEPPDLGSPPSGCPYHPRCPVAIDRCRNERPMLRATAEGGLVACWVASEPVAQG